MALSPPPGYTYALGSQDVHQFRFQSHSKKFWNRWLKQYLIIIRSRLITIHIRIHCHFSTFSEYCKCSIWQFNTNLSIKNFGLYPWAQFCCKMWGDNLM